VQQCLSFLARVQSAPAVPQDVLESMRLDVDMDFQACASEARVSAGIGVFLDEPTRMYGSIYATSTKELRAMLFRDTALAFDIRVAYTCFMLMLSTALAFDIRVAYTCFMLMLSTVERRCLQESVTAKAAVRWAVGRAYGCSLEEAKSRLHATGNGKTLARFKEERAAVALPSPEAPAELGSFGWLLRGTKLVWLLQYETQVKEAIMAVYARPALQTIRAKVEFSKQ